MQLTYCLDEGAVTASFADRADVQSSISGFRDLDGASICAVSDMSEPALPQIPHCFPLKSVFITPDGRTSVTALRRGHQILSLNGATCKVMRASLHQLRLQDFIRVSLASGGTFEVTSDHMLHACWEGKAWSVEQAGRLREGMLVRTRGCPDIIACVELKANVNAQVIELEFEDRGAVALLWAGTDGAVSAAVFVLGAQLEAFQVDLSRTFVDLRPQFPSASSSLSAASWPCCRQRRGAGLVQKHAFAKGSVQAAAPSRGSAGHQINQCAGSCPFFRRHGCKLEADCPNCHVKDCRMPIRRPGKEQRDRHKRQLFLNSLD